MPNDASSPSQPSLTYPRTGKRGVPQQFPRRLYEMLQSETALLEKSADHPKVIFWSESGRAFRIVDVPLFASIVLPRYFRTKKFSSFQRNLNLYGFSKVRRGPETDMYAHPSFVRNQPETLSLLRKLTTVASGSRTEKQTLAKRSPTKDKLVPRAVSPSPPKFIHTTFHPVETRVETSKWNSLPKIACKQEPKPTTPPTTNPKSNSVAARGRLDLLALALEQHAFVDPIMQ